MSFDESRRNDDVLKSQIADNLRAKADQAERMIELIKELKHISSGPLWRNTPVRARAYLLEKDMELHAPVFLRELAVNDTYLGNAAVAGRLT